MWSFFPSLQSNILHTLDHATDFYSVWKPGPVSENSTGAKASVCVPNEAPILSMNALCCAVVWLALAGARARKEASGLITHGCWPVGGAGGGQRRMWKTANSLRAFRPSACHFFFAVLRPWTHWWSYSHCTANAPVMGHSWRHHAI